LGRAGETVGRDRVKRLMREHHIVGTKRRGKPWRTTTQDHAADEEHDLVGRDFSTDRPDALWLADFTYLRRWEGLVFFSFVVDAYRRRIIGWQFASHMHHSDAGSQYTSYAFNQVLDDHGVLASIGSVGDAYDNAMAESFVDSFKTELIRDRVWRTRSQLELAIVEYVGWFNSTRLHEALGDRPPAEMESLYAARTVLTPSLNQ
jgi:putative transposase